ncbi:unnamed protein product [Malus baccata var. baccata]
MLDHSSEIAQTLPIAPNQGDGGTGAPSDPAPDKVIKSMTRLLRKLYSDPLIPTLENHVPSIAPNYVSERHLFPLRMDSYPKTIHFRPMQGLVGTSPNVYVDLAVPSDPQWPYTRIHPWLSDLALRIRIGLKMFWNVDDDWEGNIYGVRVRNTSSPNLHPNNALEDIGTWKVQSPLVIRLLINHVALLVDASGIRNTNFARTLLGTLIALVDYKEVRTTFENTMIRCHANRYEVVLHPFS